MKSCISVCLTLLLAGGAAFGQRATGFSEERWKKQAEHERILLAVPEAARSEALHRRLTEEPHIAGDPQQRKVAEFVLEQFRSFGLEAEIREYPVYLPYPRSVDLRLVAPDERQLPNTEDGYPEDKDSYDSRVIMPFNGYSPSGQAEADVVYANYGLPEDYEQLKKLGIDVRGKIVLVRYGSSFRGVKSRVAEEHGAAGLLIYSDPRDDGYMAGDVFPKGPYRPPSAVQRGSVQYLFVYPGDPQTPGYASTATATRVAPDQIQNLTKVPTHPLSYRNAEHIIRALAGPVVPQGWQGGLPLTYHIGPGPARIRMKLEMDYQVRPIWNVIATLRGWEEPDRVVVLGNHLDAWTYGAVDPNSGTVALLETARAFGKLLQQGIRPRRTVILAGWDGEEYGLIGSTEWAEEFKEMLSQQAVAYLNVDVAVTGKEMEAQAVPSLKEFLREASRAVTDPASGKSVYEIWRSGREGAPPDNTAAGDGMVRRPSARVGDLGSGSDYTVFLDHIGVPSLSMSFSGPYGVYHSIYDSHFWMARFGDPLWQYHPAMARLWGVAGWRLANADVLPFDYETYGREILEHAERVEKAGVAKKVELDWSKLKQQARKLQQLGMTVRKATVSIPAQASTLNAALMQVERALLLEKGLPGRPWYRHSIYAPGFYSGYASKPLPGISEAIDAGNGQLAGQQLEAVVAALARANAILSRVAEIQ